MMPSKGKKPSRPSPASSDRSSASRTPSQTPDRRPETTTNGGGDDDDEALLSEASAKYPRLISDSAFCGRVSELDPSPSKGNHATVWLSEAAMVSYSLAPGSLVSVSLAALGKGCNFPLESLTEEYARHFFIDVDNSLVSEAGCYFAINSVFPSRKVQRGASSWSGKTSLASSCVRDAGAVLFSINGPEIVSQYYGESEQTLHGVFDSARRAAPSVVFIDELDAIAPARKDGGEELSLRLVATLLKLMDEINTADGILVIAATNRPDSIDSALRRPGRLDIEIEIGVPSPEQRLDILQTLLSEICRSLSNTEIQSLALVTHGFVGADLAALCNEAAMTALRRHIKYKSSDQHLKEPRSKLNGPKINLQGSDVRSDEDLSSGDHVSSIPFYPVNFQRTQEVIDTSCEEEKLLKVTADDFEKAKIKVRPSAMREVMLELPIVRWEDVGGQTKVKKQLIEAVQWPQIYPDAFERIGIRPPRGLLMIGPPGCSKTLMARAVASEAKLNFLAVKGPELFSKWVGESEKAVRSLFAKARANSPVIIFFDEIDGLAITRGQENDGSSVADRVLSQLLVEMDGLDQRTGITVIAATNRPDKIDPALLRPGRFDRLLDVQPPDETDREDIFRIHMRNMPCSSDVITKDLAQLTEGYTGADIKLICREAAINALEESLDASEVSMAHFKIGIEKVQPSDVQFYKELAAEFRRIVDTGSVCEG